MSFVRNLSIKGKLTFIAMLTSGVALLAAGTLFTVHDYRIFRADLVRELSTQAQIVGLNVDAAVIFGGFEDAEDVLSALHVAPNIVRAAVFLPDGSPFAEYERPGAPGPSLQAPPEISGHRFEADRLFLHEPIRSDGELLGMVLLEADLSAFKARIRGYVAIAAGVLLLSSLLAFLLSSRLQRMISQPVLHLAGVARAVSEKNDYSVRADLDSRRDELGTLVEGFNLMLKQIQERDAKLEEHRVGLERKVADRTAEVTRVNEELTFMNDRLKVSNDELLQLNQDLEKATRYKSEVLAIMSHELRTPLNPVINRAEFLKREMFGPLNPRQMENAQQIYDAGKHLLSIVNLILDVAKIEAGRMELLFSSFEFQPLAEGMISMFQFEAHRREIALGCQIQPDLPTLVADQTRLKQILQNLLANALKYTDPDGRVELQASTDPGGVRFSVSDTGLGIAKEDQHLVFDHFRQVGDRTRSKGGTGLGLTLVKALVELHGGRIWVDSKLGEGSTFTFVLPNRRVAEEIPATATTELEDDMQTTGPVN